MEVVKAVKVVAVVVQSLCGVNHPAKVKRPAAPRSSPMSSLSLEEKSVSAGKKIRKIVWSQRKVHDLSQKCDLLIGKRMSLISSAQKVLLLTLPHLR
jgi:hypothetical protein